MAIKRYLKRYYSMIKKKTIPLLRLLPIKRNKIVFDNFGGRGYGCDPKYIAEALLKSDLNLDLIWLTRDMSITLPKGIRPVKYGTWRSYYELATAKIWIDNIKNGIKVPKKKKQFYIQTWHSSLGLKKNEADATTLSEYYIKAAQEDAGMTDLMYSNNAFREDRYRKSYWYSGPVIRCGHPRNSILLNKSLEVEHKVREYFKIKEEKKIVLYAPTFRKTHNVDLYKFDYNSFIPLLNNKFNGDYIFLIRLHPNVVVDSFNENLNYCDNILNASHYSDMQELLAVADVLITDYSGSMFDFLITKKPVFLFAKDLEDYCKQDRELYFNIDELPFSLAENEKQLQENIRSFSQEQYTRKCHDFIKKVDLKEDGEGATVISKIIMDKILNG